MHRMERTGQKSPAGTQEENVLWILLLYHSPPVTPPAQTFLPPGSFGSYMMARVRPPMSAPYPSQAIGVIVLFSAAARRVSAYALSSRSRGTLPVAGSRVIRY